MYCLLSQIINAAIHATVPGHNRWPISTQLLFMRLSQPSAVPQAPRQERWRNYFIARGPKSCHLWGIRREGALWIGSYCHLCCGVTHAESVSTEAGEVKLFCDCSFVLLESAMCYWEMPPGKREKKMSIKPNLPPHLHGTSPFIFSFFFLNLVLISGSTCA